MHSYIPLSGAIQFNQDLLIPVAFIFIIVHMQVSNYLISVIYIFFFRVPSIDRSTKPVMASG